MDAKKCDRCGKFFEKQDDNGEYKGGRVILCSYGSFSLREEADISIDVCPECRTDFERWINIAEIN